jgi:hypothetical protein
MDARQKAGHDMEESDANASHSTKTCHRWVYPGDPGRQAEAFAAKVDAQRADQFMNALDLDQVDAPRDRSEAH